jgi:hypothetical protein
MTKGGVVMACNGGYGKNRPQISPLCCAPVEMTKGGAVMACNGGYGKSRPQISPLRYAPVEMTKGGAVVARNGGYGNNRPQISPLRCAPVEMTKGGPLWPATAAMRNEDMQGCYQAARTAADAQLAAHQPESRSQ